MTGDLQSIRFRNAELRRRIAALDTKHREVTLAVLDHGTAGSAVRDEIAHALIEAVVGRMAVEEAEQALAERWNGTGGGSMTGRSEMAVIASADTSYSILVREITCKTTRR